MAFAKHLVARSSIFRFVRTLLVWKILWYFRFFAILALRIHTPMVIGIAGAVGKSTAKLAVSAILTSYQPTLTVDGNSETGIPLGILGLSHGKYGPLDWIRAFVLAPFRIGNLRPYKFLIIEYGIDGPFPPKNMGYLLTILKPSIAILLNESPAHVENYDPILSVQDKNLPLNDKLDRIVTFMTSDDGKIFSNTQLTAGIVNADDEKVYNFATGNVPRGKLFTVGEGSNNDISVVHHEVMPEGSRFLFAVHTHQIKDSLELVFPQMALPQETGSVVGAAVLAAIHCGISLEIIKTNLERFFSLPPGRGSIFEGIHDTTILDSSYNASSASVLSFLKTMRELKSSTKRQTVFLFGDMKELGEYSIYEHNLVAKALPGTIDHLLLIGNLTKQYVLPYAQKHKDKFKTVMWFEDTLEAGNYAAANLPAHGIVLVKGSQLLEEAVKRMLKNPKDSKKLCRQDLFWKEAKRKRGQWVE